MIKISPLEACVLRILLHHEGSSEKLTKADIHKILMTRHAGLMSAQSKLTGSLFPAVTSDVLEILVLSSLAAKNKDEGYYSNIDQAEFQELTK